MENLPLYVPLVFGFTTLIAVILFYIAANRSATTLALLIGWLVLQTIISLIGFYTITNTTPPRFLLLVLPPLITILMFFATPKGRSYIDSLNIRILTIFHIVRIPVELVLFWLFLHKAVPELMTFSGRNFDIISGLTAPFVYYFGFRNGAINKPVMLGWNMICLALLINIVVIAILSAPFTFQKFGFGQPNVAVLYFPFVWLPCCIVPLALTAHLVTIRRLLKS